MSYEVKLKLLLADNKVVPPSTLVLTRVSCPVFLHLPSFIYLFFIHQSEFNEIYGADHADVTSARNLAISISEAALEPHGGALKRVQQSRAKPGAGPLNLYLTSNKSNGCFAKYIRNLP